MRLLLLTLIFVTSLFAQKVLYFNYKDVPKRVVKGEIFSVTLKTLSVVKEYDEVKYKFSNYKGLKLLNDEPDRGFDGKYLYDKFYFLTTNKRAKLPDVTAYIDTNKTIQDTQDSELAFSFNLFQDEEDSNNTTYETTTIHGKKLNVITLTPINNFSNIVANHLEIIDYRTTTFDDAHNIIVFVAKAQNCDIGAMHFENVYKQGIESITPSYLESKIIYFLIINKEIEDFSFSYFNLLSNKFETIHIPIVVDDDSVATQSDLKPKDQSRNRIKAIIALVIAVLFTIYAIYKKRYLYLIVVVFPLAYFVWITIPSQEICIKKGSKIHLLPVRNGTIFETTSKKYYLLKEGSVDGFVKVKLYNDKIGWVRDEDICTH